MKKFKVFFYLCSHVYSETIIAMVFLRMNKTTLYSLLMALMLMFLPLAGAASPQQSDISKPTRGRVKTDDKKKDDKKKDAAADKKDAQAKAPATPKTDKKDDAPKKDDKKDAGAKKDDKPDDQKKEQATPAPAPNPADGKFDGIDVSRHQGNINWDEIKKNPKIQYVYIKATEGSDLVDECYRNNIRNARKAGLKVGSYHYLSNRSSVTTQFQNFANTANRDEQDLIPVIDVEVCKQWTPQQLRDSLMVFAKMVEDYYGCKPIIYTYETFYKSYLGKAFANYPIFIAKYPRNPNDKPNIDGVKWLMWQFAETGRIPGIKGNVDLSRFNTGYSLNDILYRPAKGKPKISVKDAVDRNKPKPATVTMTEAPKTPKANESPEVKQKEQEKAKRANDRKKAEDDKKKAEEEKKKKKAEEARKRKAKADADAKAKADADAKAKAKAKADADARAKAKADADAKAKADADAKAKRKADAQKARKEQTQRKSQNKPSTSASLYTGSSSKMAQSQRNDSIRSAQTVGRKTNKSSVDND